MEFQEYIRKKNELTKNCTLESCNTDCRLDQAAHSYNLEYCDVFESSYPEEAEKVIKDWYDKTHSTNAEVITGLTDGHVKNTLKKVIVMFKIFLSGGMANLSMEEQNGWREEFIIGVSRIMMQKKLPEPYIINPVKFYNYEDKTYNSLDEVFHFERRHVQSCDLLVVNANDPLSRGTSMEIAFAYDRDIPILILNEENKKLYEWWEICADRIFDDMNALEEYVCKYYLERISYA